MAKYKKNEIPDKYVGEKHSKFFLSEGPGVHRVFLLVTAMKKNVHSCKIQINSQTIQSGRKLLLLA